MKRFMAKRDKRQIQKKLDNSVKRSLIDGAITLRIYFSAQKWT